MTVAAHEISVVTQGRRVPGWKSYQVTQDILQPANAFSLSVKFSREAWALLDLDAEIQIFLDTTRILSGFIDKRQKVSDSASGTLISISGRDKTGRLVDESAPLLRYGGLRIRELAQALVGDLFEDGVTLENTDNRSILRNVRSRQAQVIREPLVDATLDAFRPLSGTVLPEIPIERIGTALSRTIARPPIIDPGIFQGRQAPKKIPVGASRWQVLEEILAEARLMAWSSADGRTLFVGLPNYDQTIQYLFFEPGTRSGDRQFGNAKITVSQDVANMYSAYIAVGAAKGDGSNYGPNVTKNRAAVYDNPDNPGIGTGVNFRRRKFLLISDDGIKNARDALERAEREKLQREQNYWEVIVEASGHSQLYSGETPTLFAVDSMARVIDDDTGIGIDPLLPQDWLITQATFGKQVGQPTKTAMRMVPKGTLLTS